MYVLKQYVPGTLVIVSVSAEASLVRNAHPLPAVSRVTVYTKRTR